VALALLEELRGQVGERLGLGEEEGQMEGVVEMEVPTGCTMPKSMFLNFYFIGKTKKNGVPFQEEGVFFFQFLQFVRALIFCVGLPPIK
jgi:hypothetical protein